MKQSYSDQLKSPKWQKRRLEILNLHGFKCESCGSEEKTLNVHHRFYLKGRNAWEYDNDVFQVLCEDCHKKEHKPKEQEYTPDIKRIIELISEHNIDPCNIVSIINAIKDYSEYHDHDKEETFNMVSYYISENCDDLYTESYKYQKAEIMDRDIYLLQLEIKKLKGEK